ncbi:hypothetical protein PG997_012998 [Apiospora hydei]|uniref:Uncharacterized protein n=1 Tax=Apiospora hydei TaxID=1337664 RepID=A0ABR1V4Z9_9PEZI
MSVKEQGRRPRSSSWPGGTTSVSIEELTRPTDVESRLYHFGLTGGKLVVRTNSLSNPWYGNPTQRVGYGDRTPVRKGYVALGTNPDEDATIITALRPLLPSIATVLESTRVPWTWFTGIRIGHKYGDPLSGFYGVPLPDLESRFPVVLLINVRYGTTFAQVASATRTVKTILESNGLEEIPVEVRENEVYHHTSRDTYATYVEDIVKDDYWKPPAHYPLQDLSRRLLPLLPTLSWEVMKAASNEESAKRGIAGPFMNLEGAEGLFATSCRHVLLPQPQGPYTVNHSERTGFEVSQGSPETVARLLRKFNYDLDSFKREYPKAGERVKAFDDWLETFSGPKPDEPDEFECDSVSTVRYLEDTIAVLSSVHDEPVPGRPGDVIAGTGLTKRKVGFVYAAPEDGISPVLRHSLTGFSNDWVLLKLDEEKFKKASNKIYLGSAESRTLTRSFDWDRPNEMPVTDFGLYFGLPKEVKANGGFLHMTGYLAGTSDDITTKGTPGLPCDRVVKRGAKTGLTFGVTNGIEACVRERAVAENGPGRLGMGVSGRFRGSGAEPIGVFMEQVVSGGPKHKDEYRGEQPAFDVDVTFVNMAWAILDGIERLTGKRPKLFLQERQV